VGDECHKCKAGKLESAKAAELGNVFDLGTKYTKAFDISVINSEGEKIYPIMGCYGIGISRTMGVIVETFNDERGIIWPESVAPFKVHLVSLAGKSEEVARRADNVYAELTKLGFEVLYDERENVGAGAKLADADLLGIPYRVVVSEKSGELVEQKKRNEKEAKLISLAELVKSL
jgi:prolyl-tRNA synthetase